VEGIPGAANRRSGRNLAALGAQGLLVRRKLAEGLKLRCRGALALPSRPHCRLLKCLAIGSGSSQDRAQVR